MMLWLQFSDGVEFIRKYNNNKVSFINTQYNLIILISVYRSINEHVKSARVSILRPSQYRLSSNLALFIFL